MAIVCKINISTVAKSAERVAIYITAIHYAKDREDWEVNRERF